MNWASWMEKTKKGYKYRYVEEVEYTVTLRLGYSKKKGRQAVIDKIKHLGTQFFGADSDLGCYEVTTVGMKRKE
jgi:hypothetical protein